MAEEDELEARGKGPREREEAAVGEGERKDRAEGA